MVVCESGKAHQVLQQRLPQAQPHAAASEGFKKLLLPHLLV